MDKHLPSFDFDDYPDLEDDNSVSSPRIVDDTWKKYELQSENETGATNLRHDSGLLDKIIQVFQLTPNDLRSHDKKHLLQAALRVLSNILTKGKSEDQNQDITKSSSLPTLLISILRNVMKSDLSYPDLVGDLIKNIALIGKSSFNKSIGIEPIFMKGFIPMLPFLLKE